MELKIEVSGNIYVFLDTSKDAIPPFAFDPHYYALRGAELEKRDKKERSKNENRE